MIAALATAASAEPVREDSLTTQPLALMARGGELGVEHLVREHWSAMAQIGLRGGALGDYSSTTYTGAIEVRWWLRPTMTRLYVGAHVSAGHTSLELAATGERMGTSWGLEQRVDVGWRFVIKNRVSITPSLGLGEHEDFDGRGKLAMYARPAIGSGLELGLLF